MSQPDPDSTGSLRTDLYEGRGVIYPPPTQIEPFGEETFLDVLGRYAQAALSLETQGARELCCYGILSLNQCRAALLGVRQSGLPATVIAAVSENGRLELGSEPLSVLLVSEALGAVGFSVCAQEPAFAQEILTELLPFAGIPLILETPKGFRLFAPDQVPPQPPERAEILAVWESGHAWLSPEFEFSEPLCCSMDMSQEILAAETEAPDVLCIRIESPDDAYCFSLNAHMARLPVAFLSDSEESLEMALLLYCGRAIVNPLSQLPRSTLEHLSTAYGGSVG